MDARFAGRWRHAAAMRCSIMASAREQISVTRSADMRYRRQAYELNVALPAGPLSQESFALLVEHFHQAHEKRLYGRRDAAGAVEVVKSLSVTMMGEFTVRPRLPRIAGRRRHGASRCPQRFSRRSVLSATHGWFDCVCYERSDLLGAGDVLLGSCHRRGRGLDERLVPPGMVAAVRHDQRYLQFEKDDRNGQSASPIT